MKYPIDLYQDEDGVFIAECPAIPGCVSQGKTEAEALVNVQDAIRKCLAVRQELGMTPILNVRQLEVAI